MKKPQLSELTLREKIGQCLCIPQFDILNKTEVDRNIARPLDERDELGDIAIEYKIGIAETFKENKTARRLLSEAIKNKKNYTSDLNS
jgi:hypothetical protein